jgi:hypothetical protein
MVAIGEHVGSGRSADGLAEIFAGSNDGFLPAVAQKAQRGFNLRAHVSRGEVTGFRIALQFRRTNDFLLSMFSLTEGPRLYPRSQREVILWGRPRRQGSGIIRNDPVIVITLRNGAQSPHPLLTGPLIVPGYIRRREHSEGLFRAASKSHHACPRRRRRPLQRAGDTWRQGIQRTLDEGGAAEFSANQQVRRRARAALFFRLLR